MKKLIISALFLFALSSMVFAVPLYFTCMGIVRDSSGNPATGIRPISFKIYDAASGGNLIYGQDEAGVIINGGQYSVQFGPVDSAMLKGDRYLEVAVNGLIPPSRLKIDSVPFATTAKITDAAVTGGKLASDISITTIGTVAATTIKPTIFSTPNTGGYCFGTGTITAGNPSALITNSALTASSSVFVTNTTRDSATIEALYVTYPLTPPTFTVGFTRSTTTYPFDVNFNYLIIN